MITFTNNVPDNRGLNANGTAEGMCTLVAEVTQWANERGLPIPLHEMGESSTVWLTLRFRGELDDMTFVEFKLSFQDFNTDA